MRSEYWSAASYSTPPLGSPHRTYSRLRSNCTQYHHCKWTPSNSNFQLKFQVMNDYYLNLTKKKRKMYKNKYAWIFAQMKQAFSFKVAAERINEIENLTHGMLQHISECFCIETNSHLIVLLIKVKHCCFRPSWNIHRLRQIEFADVKLLSPWRFTCTRM